jgi:formylglycine-generating enzyme required for sulfatase activity
MGEGRARLGLAFPAGATPFDVMDLCGVWEWTRSLWGPPQWTPKFSYPYEYADVSANAADRPPPRSLE